MVQAPGAKLGVGSINMEEVSVSMVEFGNSRCCGDAIKTKPATNQTAALIRDTFTKNPYTTHVDDRVHLIAMSRKSVVKDVVALGTKSITDEMDGILRAIESRVVDLQIINTLKRLLSPKISSSASTSTATTQSKSGVGLASSRIKKTTRTTVPAKKVVVDDPFPSPELVSATKTVVMKSLTALATEADSRNRKGEIAETNTARQPMSQGMRNVLVCCRVALGFLRQWQDHVHIGAIWVNKAYFGYISKLVGLEMVSPGPVYGC